MKQKDNGSFLEYPKHLKQGKEILEVNVGKYVMRNYVENIDEFKNAIGADNKKTIKYKEFIKCMEYILITNSYQWKYASLANGPSSQYLMRNNKYLK